MIKGTITITFNDGSSALVFNDAVLHETVNMIGIKSEEVFHLYPTILIDGITIE